MVALVGVAGKLARGAQLRDEPRLLEYCREEEARILRLHLSLFEARVALRSVRDHVARRIELQLHEFLTSRIAAWDGVTVAPGPRVEWVDKRLALLVGKILVHEERERSHICDKELAVTINVAPYARRARVARRL